ncbi:21028_t:CDS:1, partial [Rhizophagus irregularis]
VKARWHKQHCGVAYAKSWKTIKENKPDTLFFVSHQDGLDVCLKSVENYCRKF